MLCYTVLCSLLHRGMHTWSWARTPHPPGQQRRCCPACSGTLSAPFCSLGSSYLYTTHMHTSIRHYTLQGEKGSAYACLPISCAVSHCTCTYDMVLNLTKYSCSNLASMAEATRDLPRTTVVEQQQQQRRKSNKPQKRWDLTIKVKVAHELIN